MYNLITTQQFYKLPVIWKVISLTIYSFFTCSEERRWRKWADDVFVHTLSPNVYRTLDESYRTFNWFSDVSNFIEIHDDIYIYLILITINAIENLFYLFTGWKMGGVFPAVGAYVDSECRRDGNVVNRKETQKETPSKGRRATVVV